MMRHVGTVGGCGWISGRPSLDFSYKQPHHVVLKRYPLGCKGLEKAGKSWDVRQWSMSDGKEMMSEWGRFLFLSGF